MNDRPSDTLRTARLVVGLGNPGAEYADTRHNVGFRVLDHLADELGLLFRGPSALQVPNASPGNGGSSGPGFGGFQWARTDGEPFGWLLQPLTYMNRSGEVVAPFARWLARHGALPALPMEEPIDGDVAAEPDAPPRKRKKAPRVEPDPAQILVVYDDMDLEPGQLRLRPHGGHGGQNGMRDIIDRLRTDRFPRLRVGIGRAGTDAARHVLGRFTPAEEEIVGVSIAEASEAARAFLEGEDFSGLMTRFHSRWKGSG